MNGNDSPDLLSDTLDCLRIQSTILLREAYTPPWTIAIPDSARLSGLLNMPDTQVVAFHFVEQGSCAVQVGEQRNRLETGQLAICFGGETHQLTQGSSTVPMPLETLLRGGKNIFGRPGIASHDATRLLCGAFVLRNFPLNPLLRALPPLLHTTMCGEDNLAPLLLQRMRREIDRNVQGGGFIVNRLAEALCVEVIRSYADNLSYSEGSWLRGIRDPVIGQAIASIHAAPAHQWSVTSLADGAALSPSRFAARFVEIVGIAPMRYVAQWRIHTACTLLRDTSEDVAQIALHTGYEHLPAFYRAFKRSVGSSPGEYRLSSISGIRDHSVR